MHEFHGDLLIGGLRLRGLLGQLADALPNGNGKRANSKECELSGHLHLPTEQSEQLQLNREYRIELENGLAAQVVFSRIAADHDNAVVADFVPPRRKPNRRPVKARPK